MRRIEEKAREMGFTIDLDTISPGDHYLAERNTGPALLTCHTVTDNYVVPKEVAYCYNVHECVKVVGAVCSFEN